ncbi:hypothetical protein [Halomonas dongshanensis]|uniref:Uncharacterized protein n=1 Tax=Halomonas dongshanensis TaxID=2890835 RepID=A0ABT2ED16_9GAMM|nr:hypothetical protein [Halomonas dongshanensis]MCS2608554.1 hypothetical protein [Halomonas dongshanensis]
MMPPPGSAHLTVGRTPALAWVNSAPMAPTLRAWVNSAWCGVKRCRLARAMLVPSKDNTRSDP